MIHMPLHPRPGEMIRLIAKAESGPGASVAEISISAGVPGVGNVQESCSLMDQCVLEIPSGGTTGLSIYNASATDSRGRRAASASSYVFQIGVPSGEVTFPLRAPFDLYDGSRTFKILLVRDRESYTDNSAVLLHATNLVYDSLLKDPAYRWRDNQLAFYYTTYEGVTRDYHSGAQSRCGQEPWVGAPHQREAELAGAFADVVAVIHQKDAYRDGAGLGLVISGAGAKRHFSAHGLRPHVFHHELGHALAGLSDEYFESTASRTTGNTDLRGVTPVCGCCMEDIGVSCLPGVPICGVDPIPPECFPAAPACPAMESTCPHPNVFSNRRECEAAAAFIGGHSGVELETDPADCRLLCPSSEEACPCLSSAATSEVWLLDRRSPPIPGAVPDDDIMGEFDTLSPGEWIGAAGESCTETTFCLQWEIGRGRTQAEAEMQCLRP